ncbi:2-hydroxyacyl-CoA dehydratase family protein [Anaerosacchariphilus polymeriproducens]|uniref:2-hydroxyacyl-CoA dehydratase n=1 Tax=Anaerosacchariphilus polymeriproducens TaxID=1812858 RepID=A0A371AXP0_9FIRM|nr:2-hydroxyacyl-CoA dehydratase [Anaerosacchariphilus polymeriproducens]RDU24292.1 2-hydroxyacyl-CoA dehydratase [Anaerosacchariphilus polymeriproducens]
MNKIGITTTVPIEIVYCAGLIPIDLNNIFVTAENNARYIEVAEKEGFPKSMCAWIKGLYGVCMEHQINELIGVIEGDCSNSKSLIELWKQKGKKIYPFSFPYSQKKKELEKSLSDLMEQLQVDLDQVEEKRKELNQIRRLVQEIDRLTFEEEKVTGFENHLYQVSCSDFQGDPKSFAVMLQSVLDEMKSRTANPKKLRLGYIGVPPMTIDIYDYVETLDARIIYNEVQREFTFPRAGNAVSIIDQYLDYTYPYGNLYRIEEIKKQIEKRKLDGIIHYTQAFCHRALDDIMIKSNIDIPILNIEGDQSPALDARTKLRIEAFIDMLSDLKGVYQ